MENAEEPSMFLVPPTEEITKECLQAFYDSTSNNAVQTGVCAVCAREELIVSSQLQRIRFSKFPHPKRLKPAVPHSTDLLLRGCFLLTSVCTAEDDPLIPVCAACVQALQSPGSDPPRFALANGLWPGEIPFCLQALTLPEQLLIARIYARVHSTLR